jgi:uncharacterized protein YndB with AHSA1/START domain
MTLPPTITVKTIVNTSLEKVWQCFTSPEHIVKWAFASEDWEAPAAENDLKVGGRFKTVMAAKNKSSQFDFTGVYTRVEKFKFIEYDMDEAPGEAKRHVKVEFFETPAGVEVVETFEPEHENSAELQSRGWQGILDNFKKYAESI